MKSKGEKFMKVKINRFGKIALGSILVAMSIMPILNCVGSGDPAVAKKKDLVVLGILVTESSRDKADKFMADYNSFKPNGSIKNSVNEGIETLIEQKAQAITNNFSKEEKITVVNVIKEKAKLSESSVNTLTNSASDKEKFKSELAKIFKDTPEPDYKNLGQNPSLEIRAASTTVHQNWFDGCYDTLACYTVWGRIDMGGAFWPAAVGCWWFRAISGNPTVLKYESLCGSGGNINVSFPVASW